MFDSSVIIQRINKSCLDKHINKAKMLHDLGYGKNLIYSMKTTKDGISLAKFQAIAEYLGVSADYLLGLSDNPEILK